LEGLEVSEVLLSRAIENKDSRMDSDFWTKEPKKNPKLQYKKIGDILTSSQYGISIAMNEDGIGYPIYRMNEIHNMLCDLAINKSADITASEFEKFELKDKDVLFNRTNSFEWVGRTGIYYQNDKIARIFASYLVRFNPDENIVLPEYLATFLNTKQGIWDVKRRARQSINQTNVNPEEVKEIEIPVLPMDFQKQIRIRFEEANKNRILSQSLYRQAEELFLETIGLNHPLPIEEARISINIKSFKESFLTTGRLDAEYYQQKYEEIENIIKSYPNGYCKLKDIGEFRNGSLISDKFYVNKSQRAYIRIKELSFNQPISDNDVVFIDDSFIATNETTVHTNDFVFATIGNTIGKVNLIPECYNGSFISNNTSRFRSSKIEFYPFYELLFRTIIVQEQIQKEFTQTAQPKIGNESLENIIIPLVNKELQRRIAELVTQSFTLRKESERLLVEAKETVEGEISASNKLEQSQAIYRQAEELLLENIGLNHPLPTGGGGPASTLRVSKNPS
jgi:restriction endonuclease S subunit